MDKQELQRLRELPIEGVAERLGLRVLRHKSLCPFHEDRHPSLSFNMRRNTFRCFVCDAHGGTIDLVMRHLNLDFCGACRWLADAHSIITEDYRPASFKKSPEPTFDPARYLRYFEHPWLSEDARRFLYEERRLSPRVVEWCRLTSWRDRRGTPWLQTPYYDMEGKLIGVQNRRLSPLTPPTEIQSPPSGIVSQKGSEEPPPRFRFPAGSRCSIYNLPILRYLQPGEQIWITEGCSDCWAMLSYGRKAIAIPSATLLGAQDKALLTSLSSSLSLNWNMYPDHDEPGEHLFLQLREVLPDLQHHQLPVGCKDFSDYYLQKLHHQKV